MKLKKSTGMSEGFMLNKTEEAKINKEEAGSTRPKKAHVITYGCKQNENDSEKIRGMLSGMGYTICTIVDEADVVIFNTCAVRDNAEQRVYGNLGALRALKDKKPDVLIGVCGCMAQQSHVAEHIKKRFPFVDFVFGTHAISRFPQILQNAKTERVFDIDDRDSEITEGIPHDRPSIVTSTVSIMYGCNNFCSYCIVPYVRGREKSRQPEDILREVESLAAQGCKEVTLLGQNVNSYSALDFADLLNMVSKIEGIRRIRFISSHPKDLTDKLIDTMATNPKVCKQLHLPFQAGSSKVLKDMNRGYSKEEYLSLIKKVKEKIPYIALTSDVIVGFPTETQQDFEETIEVVCRVEFDMLFTFIYSKRKGTPAEHMAPVLAPDDVKRNFERLVAVQNEISGRKNKALEGSIQEVLVEGTSKNNANMLTGRTDGGKIVNFQGGIELVGKMVNVKITKSATWSLIGSVL